MIHLMMKTTLFLVLLLTIFHDSARALPQMPGLPPPGYLDIPGYKLCTETKAAGSANFTCLPERKPKYCERLSWFKLWELKELCPCKTEGFASLPECLELSCPSFSYTTIDRRNFKKFEYIWSYEECSRKCYEEPTCNYWTWENKHAPLHFALVCSLMSDYGYKIPSEYSVSGKWNCNIGPPGSMTSGPGVNELSCYSVDTNTVARRDEQVLKRIGSAEECSKKCREKTTCKFWTWANKNTGRWALDCVLMSGYRNTAWDDNIISGARDCPEH